MDLSASRNLSCQRCRARKIKCDRSEPCSTCARSGETCVYPSRRQSRTRKSRKADLEVLRSRVTQLEELLSDVTTHHSPTHTLDREIESSAVSGTTITVSTPEVGDLISHGESIQYHSVYHWASACEKVRDLNNLLANLDLDDGSDDMLDDHSKLCNSQQEQTESSAFPFEPRLVFSLNKVDDILSQRPVCEVLFSRFLYSINVLMRLFHKDTLQYKYAEFMGKLHALAANAIGKTTGRGKTTKELAFEAVILAIFFTAATSIKDTLFFEQIGYSRDELRQGLKRLTQNALLRARFLESPSLESLQALTLYLICHYMETPLDKTCWPLVGMLIRLAQSLGLHRDPLQLQVSLGVIEVEIRRRLWYHICGLDQISAEFHGPRPSIRIDDFDTLLPRNVDDADLSFEASFGSKRLPDGGRFTEMTVILIRMSTIRCFMLLDRMFCETSPTTRQAGCWNFSSHPYNLNMDSQTTRNSNIWASQMEGIITATVAQHESEYLNFCDGVDPMQQTTRLLAPLTEAKLWLFYYRLLSGRARQLKQGVNAVDRKACLLKSITLLERVHERSSGHASHDCYWLSSGILQLHAIFQLLQELAPTIFNQDPLPDQQLRDQCWKCIDRIDFEGDGKAWTILRRVKEIASRARAGEQISSPSNSVSVTSVAPDNVASDQGSNRGEEPKEHTLHEDYLNQFDQEWFNDMADNIWPLTNQEWYRGWTEPNDEIN